MAGCFLKPDLATMTDFRERLQRATERGRQARALQLDEAAAKALSEEECRRLHSQYRLQLTDHIEKCLGEMADNFPGFRVEPVVDATGWGAAVSRDDLAMAAGRRASLFSRFQIVVGPFNTYRVLDLAAKGTVRNKEVLSRSHYQRLAEVDLQTFRELVETWAIDFAELYAEAT